jgi:CheY-like chemotaxis protein
LVAEDNHPNLRVTLLMLKHLGYEADAAVNGLEVLHALEKQCYDLVLMDILMPKMDGLTAAKEIRRRWPNSKLPRIIAYTAYVLQDDGTNELLKDMDGFLYKPVRIGELKNTIECCMKRQEKGRSIWIRNRRPGKGISI